MYICLCNPFTDKDVKTALQGCCGRATVGEIYKECSGGETPNCCSCLETLKSMVQDHNSRETVRELSETLATDPIKQTA